MCGIAGYVDWRPEQRVDPHVLQKMTETLRLRGPDATGTWTHDHVGLGHGRLAVIDPAGGLQPMTTTLGDRPVTIVYNGMVYNFRELRSDLAGRGHVFHTGCDTEVILRAYVEWGQECVRRLRGMFAFAVWDGRTQELLLARDRFGTKPLYYAHTETGLVFGSERKTLLAHDAVQPRLTLEGVAELFVMAPMTTPGHGVLDGIVEVLPGTTVRYRRQGLERHRYWSLPAQPHTDDLDQTSRRIREHLERVIDEQLVSDVPLAALLSGGVDSSALCAVAAQQLRTSVAEPLSTFAVDYELAAGDVTSASSAFHRDADAPFAWMAARHIDSRHRPLAASTDDLLSAQQATVKAMDGPSYGPIMASLQWMFSQIRPSATTVLSGEGADEAFGSYAWFADPADYDHDGFPWHRTYRNLVPLLRDDVRHAIDPERYVEERYEAALDDIAVLPGEDGHARRLRQASGLTNAFYLRFLQDRLDRTSAQGLEVRVPFLDHEFFTYAANIPWAMKHRYGTEKWVLRAAVADLLPEAVVWRRKSGYPAAQTASYQAALWNGLRTIVADAHSPVLQFVDPVRVNRMLDQNAGPLKDWTALLHASYLLDLDLWLRLARVETV